MRRVRFECTLVNALMPKICCFSATLLALSACSVSDESHPVRQEKSVLYISVPNGQTGSRAGLNPETKTIIGGENLDKVLWSEKDRIRLYYRPVETEDAFAPVELGVYRIYPDETVFTGEVTVSEGTTYDCRAVYPEPESVSGDIAVFDLPATQNGLYDSGVDGTSCDIMVASPLSGQDFGENSTPVELSFIHKCHAFRIQIPTGKNHFGMDVKKLRVEFPSEVVGKLSVDMSDPEAPATLSEGVSTVWLDLTKVLKESETGSADGIYAWIFTAPTTVSGDVRFTAYSRENYQSESISVNLDKTLEAGRITPVTLAVPAEPEYASMTLKVGTNNLGEDYRTVTVKAPAGAKFRNGAETVVFERNEAEEYPIEFYASVDGADNLTPMKSGDMTVEFESEHAIVSAEPISLADFSWGEEPGRTFDRDVPYLLYEDFSGATARDGDNQTEMLDSYNLPGWSASNYSISAGQSIRIHAYVGGKIGDSLIDEKTGRIDSPFLEALKDNGTVNLKATFDYCGTRSRNVGVDYSFGTTTADSYTAIGSDTEIMNRIIDYKGAGDGGSYTEISNTETATFSATKSDRLSWRVKVRCEGIVLANTVYVYIDNIKVQIAPEETGQ